MKKQGVFLSAGVGLLGLALTAGVATTGTTAAMAPASAGASVEKDMADLATGRLRVPPELVPPTGNVPTAVFAAKGVQVYRCTKAADAPAAVWTFVEPVATLAGTTVRPRRLATAVHFRGPSWQSDQDGSLIEGKAKASSPVTGSIPQLLVQATRTQGTGVFGQVSYVQRLATRGGAAPAGACTEGAVTGVPYRAVYRFFKAAA